MQDVTDVEDRSRIASVHVGVLTSSRRFWQEVQGTLAAGGTAVAQFTHLDMLTTSSLRRGQVLSVLIVDDFAQNATADLITLRKVQPRTHILVLRIRDYARCRELLNTIADDVAVDGCSTWSHRIGAAIRRARVLGTTSRLRCGDVTLDQLTRRVYCRGIEIRLTPREVDLLEGLLIVAPAAVSWERLAAAVWGKQTSPDRRGAVQVHICNIRRKLPQSTVTIRHSRECGYWMESSAASDTDDGQAPPGRAAMSTQESERRGEKAHQVMSAVPTIPASRTPPSTNDLRRVKNAVACACVTLDIRVTKETRDDEGQDAQLFASTLHTAV